MIGLVQAFVLHQRDYRETSRILHLLTAEAGRLDVVARGVRGSKSRSSGLLQPFQPIWISWSGRGDLKSLTRAEPAGMPLRLKGRQLYSGLYINELLVRLLQAGDVHESLFQLYLRAIEALSSARTDENLESVLRQFELQLLDELGYAIPFPEAGLTGPFYYSIEGHFEVISAGLNYPPERCFDRPALDAIALSKLDSQAFRRDAKRLIRLALHPFLGDKPLKSREFFRQHRE